jgi:hypothetical protein
MLSEALGLASVGLSLFGAMSAADASDRQAEEWEEQKAVNRAIGAFNMQVAQRQGTMAVNAVIQQTKQIVGKQLVSFANRGITMEGSPLYVIGNTITMGSQKAQEEDFNAQVRKKNYEFQMESGVANANAMAENARYRSLSSTMDIFKGFIEGARLIKSMASAPAVQKSSIFDNATWMI